jgi:hypothetical protein
MVKSFFSDELICVSHLNIDESSVDLAMPKMLIWL